MEKPALTQNSAAVHVLINGCYCFNMFTPTRDLMKNVIIFTETDLQSNVIRTDFLFPAFPFTYVYFRLNVRRKCKQFEEHLNSFIIMVHSSLLLYYLQATEWLSGPHINNVLFSSSFSHSPRTNISYALAIFLIVSRKVHCFGNTMFGRDSKLAQRPWAE